ncbi:DUF302 domain-containing protein [Jannaschia sp. W003]|uniref:DUF302 domain-containing protein n=1 Tax=Jannaschia sp. W003 TaxID=2867012 RepID=UPI0021A6733D|nr:DUF302 domain-containing protein [Jannaschia sp. W003]UWQ21121.1 DUF302 domain-containing protein [Jannaschia sp. W003]
MTRTLAAATAALAILAAPAVAQSTVGEVVDDTIERIRMELDDLESEASPDGVAETMDRLVAAVEEAGATVFARVDHAQGARDVDMVLPESQLLIFGNPQLGTPVMQEDILAGLYLPLRVLVHATPEGSVLVWEEPEELFDDLEVDDDLEAIGKMEDALEMLAKKAAGS